jgi:hypothetical protein
LSRLERGDANVAVELGAPRWLVLLDQEPERAAAGDVPCGGTLAAAPVREVMRKPARRIESAALERVLELELVGRADDGRSMVVGP